jgi:hypothetical protein
MGRSPQDAPGIGLGLTHEKGPVGIGKPAPYMGYLRLYDPRGAERIGQVVYLAR